MAQPRPLVFHYSSPNAEDYYVSYHPVHARAYGSTRAAHMCVFLDTPARDFTRCGLTVEYMDVKNSVRVTHYHNVEKNVVHCHVVMLPPDCLQISGNSPLLHNFTLTDKGAERLNKLYPALNVTASEMDIVIRYVDDQYGRDIRSTSVYDQHGKLISDLEIRSVLIETIRSPELVEPSRPCLLPGFLVALLLEEPLIVERLLDSRDESVDPYNHVDIPTFGTQLSTRGLNKWLSCDYGGLLKPLIGFFQMPELLELSLEDICEKDCDWSALLLLVTVIFRHMTFQPLPMSFYTKCKPDISDEDFAEIYMPLNKQTVLIHKSAEMPGLSKIKNIRVLTLMWLWMQIWSLADNHRLPDFRIWMNRYGEALTNLQELDSITSGEFREWVVAKMDHKIEAESRGIQRTEIRIAKAQKTLDQARARVAKYENVKQLVEN